jgi:hypothetical protein
MYDPDRFFPVTVLYMILILPRHCLIYDPDSSLSLSYNMILNLPRHSHIWSWFFPVTVISQALVARTTPLFSNFLFTNLFSIKCLYFFIISSLFPYFNLFVSISIQSYVNSNCMCRPYRLYRLLVSQCKTGKNQDHIWQWWGRIRIIEDSDEEESRSYLGQCMTGKNYDHI